MKTPAFVSLSAVLFFAGCATSYESSNILSGGYSETPLAPDVVRIVFHGNSITSKERVQDLALMRAADLSLKAGFPYFTVLKETNERVEGFDGDPMMSTPKTQILVQFLKEKPAGILAYDSAFLIQTMKSKYKIQ